MRISPKTLRVMCQVLYRELSASWKRTFLLIATALFIYLFIVFEFVSSSLTPGAGGLRLNWVYDRLLNVPEPVTRSINTGTASPEIVTGPTYIPDASRKHPNDFQKDPNDARKDPNDATRKDPNDIRKDPNDDSALYCEDLRIGIALEGSVEDSLLRKGDPFEWQRVGGRFHETYVFSAYYDDRQSPANRVVIVGISDEYAFRESVSPSREFCQVWYPGDGREVEEDVYDVVEADFSFVPEHHDLRFAASLHFCPLTRNDSIPLAVSLIVDRCRQSPNIIRVQNDFRYDQQKVKKKTEGPEVEFTVCISPLINSYSDYQQLVENVEVNRIFGADEFIFYNHSMDDAVIAPVLNSYLKDGIFRAIVPWKIPPVDVHYVGQVAALNDCLYRSMYRSRFIVFTDLDELIVPRRHGTWNEMLDAVVGKYGLSKDGGVYCPSTYIFRNTFFPKDWMNKSRHAEQDPQVRSLGLRTLQLNVREDKVYEANIRSKYMVRSSVLEMVGIHFPFRTLPVYSPTVNVNPAVGLVHHYRDQSVEQDEFVGEVFDSNIYRFQDLIISRTRDRYARLEAAGKKMSRT